MPSRTSIGEDVARTDAPKVNKSLTKALRILEAFREETPEWGVSDLARHLGSSKSSVSTMLATLADFDLVERSPGTARYRLGLRCLEMGYLASSRLVLRDLAFPLLERLLGDARQIVYLGIPYQDEVLYVEALYPAHRRINFSSQGRRAPLYCTGIGKALLAYLPERERRAYLARAPFERLTASTLTTAGQLAREVERVRADGFAVDREERERGIQCVAAPVLDREGHALAAISVSGSDDEITADRIPDLAQRVSATALDATRKVHLSGYRKGGG